MAQTKTWNLEFYIINKAENDFLENRESLILILQMQLSGKLKICVCVWLNRHNFFANDNTLYLSENESPAMFFFNTTDKVHDW